MSDEVLIRDRAGCVWVFGLGFAAAGVVLTTMLLSVAEGRPTGGWLVGAWAVAIAHTCAGAAILVKNPHIEIRLGADSRTLRVVRGWPFLRRARELHIDQIHSIVVREGKDSDGDPLYDLELVLGTGERLEALSVPYNTPEPIDAALERIRRWSRERILVRRESRDRPLPPGS